MTYDEVLNMEIIEYGFYLGQCFNIAITYSGMTEPILETEEDTQMRLEGEVEYFRKAGIL